MGEANESKVIVEGQETKDIIRFWFSNISYFMDVGKKIESETQTTPIHFTN